MWILLKNSAALLIFSNFVWPRVTCSNSTEGSSVTIRPWFEDENRHSERAQHRNKENSGAPLFIFTPGDDILPQSDGNSQYCRRPAVCERLNYSTCMGVRLPYSYTTRELICNSLTQEQIQEKLQLWRGLRHIPKCWAVIQPFLCALYMPKCENGSVSLPSQEMYKMPMGPCRILGSDSSWSSIFKCNDAIRFPPMCKNEARELRFNTTAQCLAPLVPTDNTGAFYDGVEGCGLPCQDPLFTDDEHKQIHQLVAGGGAVCLLFSLFTVVTFLVDWRSASRYPALVIFYISGCFVLASLGWLAQFAPGARTDIVCRKDGTLRQGEPSAGENLSCVIIFVLVYYFIMAAMVWFVILAYAWHLSFQALGKIQERIDKKGAYFHLVAWSLPLVLTITTMALGEIDGDSVAGVCFVGYENRAARAGFLLGPLLVTLIVGGYFLSRGMITLVHLKITSKEVVSERASAKIRETIVRMGLFCILSIVFTVVTIVCHTYEFQHRQEWRDSLRRYIICRITRSAGSESDLATCKMESRPSVMMLQLHLLALFCAGVVMSSWVWTGSTVDTWKRFLRRVSNTEVEEPVRLKKHKLIAQAFAKRKTFTNAGRLSLSFHNTHEDPVGLNFDINSVASQDFSSTWAAALPKLMTRRGALVGPTTGSGSSQRRNSMDSEISYSVRRVSVESRRNSLDSQVSVQIAEVTATRKAVATPLPTFGTSRRAPRSKRRRRDFGRSRNSRVGPLFARRGSSTSQESQLGAQILTALTIGNSNISSLVPNLMKRREGNAGLPGNSPEASDDEVSEASEVLKFDVIFCGAANDIELEKGITKVREVEGRTGSDWVGQRSKGEGEERSIKATCVTEEEGRRSKESYTIRSNKNRRGRCLSKSEGDGKRPKDVTTSKTDQKSKEGQVSKSEPEGRRSKVSDNLKTRTELDGNKTDDTKLDQGEDSEIDVVSDDSSFCAELSKLAVHSSHSGVSVGTQSYFTTGSVGRTICGNIRPAAREIGTQTSPDDIEMTEILPTTKVQNLERCTSQSTQVSPTETEVRFQHDADVPMDRGFDYSYNTLRLVQELAEKSGPPIRPQRRKSSQGKALHRSHSVDSKRRAELRLAAVCD